tara:strand:- start:119 stop:493 length:375 start_codon:yes stop_codon:yes gene_type:complete
MINVIDLLGRIFISLIFLISGINKIQNYYETIDWMEGFGVHGIFIIPAIILEIAAPILIIMGYYVKISSTLLALFCIATAIIFSSNFTDQMQIISFLKNIALAGGCLILAVNGPKKYSLENKLK